MSESSVFDVIRELWELDESVGYDAAAIDPWRQRFGTVPAVLEEYYLTLGAHPELNHTQDHLVAPLGTAGVPYTMDGDESDHLIFYVENQAALSWGIPAHTVTEADPFVEVLVGDVWQPTRDHVSQFLIAQAHLQRMYSWEDASEDFLKIDDSLREKLATFLPDRHVSAGVYEGVEFYGGPGVVLAYFHDSRSVYFAAEDWQRLTAIFAFISRS